ncbi:4'-phosphopantetheinyl transferase family protein [Dyella sp.]|uniref:4'-phosphopantetheinyl transferase family protein n=1 Tax=Dyella sp. TaxID=1869338 RepID=UPI002F935052
MRASNGLLLPVHLTAFDIEAFSFEAFATNDIACPPAVERSVRKRQAEFFHGRAMARKALEALNISAAEIPAGTSRQPIWPSGVVGSISHTHRFAAAVALSAETCAGVGIDMEHIAGADACAALSATAMHEQELRYLQRLESTFPFNVLLTAVFSAKESFFKGAFSAVGRYFDFSAAQVSMLDIERGVIQLRLTETLCERFVGNQICDVGVGFVDPDTVLTYFVWQRPVA